MQTCLDLKIRNFNITSRVPLFTSIRWFICGLVPLTFGPLYFWFPCRLVPIAFGSAVSFFGRTVVATSVISSMVSLRDLVSTRSQRTMEQWLRSARDGGRPVSCTDMVWSGKQSSPSTLPGNFSFQFKTMCLQSYLRCKQFQLSLMPGNFLICFHDLCSTS